MRLHMSEDKAPQGPSGSHLLWSLPLPFGAFSLAFHHHHHLHPRPLPGFLGDRAHAIKHGLQNFVNTFGCVRLTAGPRSGPGSGRLTLRNGSIPIGLIIT